METAVDIDHLVAEAVRATVDVGRQSRVKKQDMDLQEASKNFL